MKRRFVTKELIIVGGPNGAGKTTFALEYLVSTEQSLYLSADAIAKGLAPDQPHTARIEAGREFIRRLNAGLTGDRTLIVESTLSGRSLRRVFTTADGAGFQTSIVMIYLDSDDMCVARVRHRVRKGGHDVPSVDIRRRYSRSLKNFWNDYRFLADQWMLVYNAEAGFMDVAGGVAATFTVHDDSLFSQFSSCLEDSHD